MCPSFHPFVLCCTANVCIFWGWFVELKYDNTINNQIGIHAGCKSNNHNASLQEKEAKTAVEERETAKKPNANSNSRKKAKSTPK